jgi:TRAP-type transport system periplasmic protein
MMAVVGRIAALIGALAFSGSAGTAEILQKQATPPRELIFATTIPSFAPIASEAFEPWARAISAASEGTIVIRVLHGVSRGSSRTIYDSVIHGVADIGYIGIGAAPGWFRRSSIAQLPFLVADGKAASVAMWRLYERGLFADEFRDVHLLAIHAFPPSALHLRKPVSVLDDLHGRRVISVYESGQRTLQRLGAAPLSIQLPDMYVSLSQGLADGTVMGWAAFPPFKLHEVVGYHVDVPLGSGAGFLAVRNEVWESLPPAARRAFAQYSGQQGSATLGEEWQRIDARAREFVRHQGQPILTLTEKERARWRARSQPVIDEWVRSTPQGAQILDAFRDELERAPKFVAAAAVSREHEQR